MTTPKNIVVYGATSAICHELVKQFVQSDTRFYLVARNAKKVNDIADDLTARGATIAGTSTLDFNQPDELSGVLPKVTAALGTIDLAIVAHGSLPNQAACEQSDDSFTTSVEDNYLSTARIVLAIIKQLEQQGWGRLAVFSSVAGDRGRKSNYIYGASKAALNALLEGLKGKLVDTEISITTIKPGLIESPMTEGIATNFLWSTPAKIAPGLYKAIMTNKSIVYSPWYWALIMTIIKLLPGKIMYRLSI